MYFYWWNASMKLRMPFPLTNFASWGLPFLYTCTSEVWSVLEHKTQCNKIHGPYWTKRSLFTTHYCQVIINIMLEYWYVHTFFVFALFTVSDTTGLRQHLDSVRCDSFIDIGQSKPVSLFKLGTSNLSP